MNTIICSKCGNEIAIDQALEEQARKLIEEKVKGESRKEIEILQKDAEDKAFKKAAEKFEFEAKQRMVEFEENKKQNSELREQLIALTKQLSQVRQKAENQELEMHKQMSVMQDKIFADAKMKAEEEHKMRIAELTKKLDDAAKSNEDLNRKLHQGSQQLQGEVQELDLENVLRHNFRDDDIEPVGKGVLGADIRQVVKSPRGIECGRILWESKRTKAWSDGWIPKLKGDLLADKSHIPVIISDVLPDEAKTGIGYKDGVWIAGAKYAVILSALLRKSLLDAAKQKIISEKKQTKAEELYGYVTSVDFIHQMEAMIEMYRDMQSEIQTERNAFERIWKKREMQVAQLLAGVNGIYGSMQGIAGNALPSVKGMLLTDAER